MSILIQKYVYCSLHGMLEILFSIKILLITNEMKFTISNYLSATLTMFITVEYVRLPLKCVRPLTHRRRSFLFPFAQSPFALYILFNVFKRLDLFLMNKIFLKENLMLIPCSYPLSVTISSMFF